ARDEVFGPVLSVLTFRTPDEAVAKANNTTYGLSAGVWSEKGSRILAVADRLRAGVVWANTFNEFDPTSPFGGYKQSGYGREGGGGACLQPRTGALPGGRGDGGPARPVRRGGRRRRGAVVPPGGGRRRRRERPVCLVRRLDRQAGRRPGRRQPGRGAVLQPQ